MPRKCNGPSSTRTYAIWHDMRRRCDSPQRKGYANYGGRGIQVCDRWHTFANFLADMGEAPQGYSIERRDVHGNYEPANCSWATRKEQNDNTQRTVRLRHNGQTKTLTQWSELLGIPHGTLRARYDKGWPAERILAPSSRFPQRIATIDGVTQTLREWAAQTGGNYKSMVVRARDPRATDARIVFGSEAVDWRRQEER